MYHAYASYHSHLPEELFFDDFATFFKKANSQTFKQLSKTFEKCDSHDEEQEEEEPMKLMQETISR